MQDRQVLPINEAFGAARCSPQTHNTMLTSRGGSQRSRSNVKSVASAELAAVETATDQMSDAENVRF